MYGVKPTPFRVVHQVLSQRLNVHTNLVERTGDAYSENIFGQTCECTRWKKL